ncbi:solute carrier family 22 member 7-like [Pleurodeles waltl]|uniref:solute carrier family 22 member 7-like n=1 Tax=Pleurodeles waltl TaxID=8319 RepID=UPI0037096476
MKLEDVDVLLGMKSEDLLLEAGGFGRFQVFILLLIAIPRVTLPLHFLLDNFLAAVPPHHCALQGESGFGNLTAEELLLIRIPREPDGTFSSCKMYIEPQWHLLENYTWGPPNNSNWRLLRASPWGQVRASTWRQPNSSSWGPPNNSTWRPPNASNLESCQYGWTYNRSQFTATIATQWDLVCEQKRLSQASATFFFIGVMVGAIVFGYLSDRYGRRSMLLVCYVLTLVFGMAAAASINYPMLTVFRSLSGMSLSGFSSITLAMSVEWMDTKHRTLAGCLSSLCWSFGNMLLSLLAYLIRDWRWLLFAATSPCILMIISIRWLPESPRWLLTKGKVKEAHTVLVQCSSMNGKAVLSSKISTETLRKIAEEENTGTNYSYIDLFRTPVLRRISVCAAVVWFGVAFCYYGISLNITGLGLDMYMTQFVYGAIEVPSKLGVYVFMDKGGRRHAQAWTLLITGFCIGINTVIPVSLGPLRTTIAIIGKGFSEASFTSVLLYTAELYPTVLRQNGIGYNSFIARIGVSVAPLIILLDDLWKVLPQIIYCAVAIVSGLVAFCLPETLNVRLPETVKDIEETRRPEAGPPEAAPKELVSLRVLEKI